MALELQPRTDALRPGSTQTREFKLPSLTHNQFGERERMFFTEQLALLLETGANLYNALLTLKEQAPNSAMRAILGELTEDVAGGLPFSQALAKHPRVFSPSYVNLIAASEKGGFMHTVLNELRVMEEKRAELKRTVVSALSYPAFLMFFSIAVVVFILLVVFPKFGDLFTSIYDELPVTTRALMSMSNVLLDYGVYILIGLAASVMVIYRTLAAPGGRTVVDQWLLRLPFVSGIVAETNLVQIFRIMSLSLTNGVAMVDTLRACQDVVSNKVIKNFIGRVEQLVAEGERISRGFEQATFVPAIAKTMISTGEESGKLALVTGRVADYYEAQLTQRLKGISKMAEPVMLLVMGAVVGLLVSSLILPIFKLARAVS